MSAEANSPQSAASRKTLAVLQASRGLAAIAVVLFHATLITRKYCGAPEFGRIFLGGHLGVPFFFVLSGFVIAYTQRGKEKGGRYALGFVRRRFRRIYLPYWVVCLSIFPAILMQLWGNRDAVWGTAAAWLLLPSATPPFLGVAWTLVHEVLFYAVFALTIALRRWGWGLFAVWQLAIAVSWAKNWDFSDVGAVHYLLSPANLLFPLGLAASALPQLRKLPAWLLFGFGSVAFLCIMLLSHPAGGGQISSDQSRSLVAGVAAFLIIWAGTQEAVEMRLGAWASRLDLLGDASYAIYLVHYPVLSLLSKLMPRLSPPIFFCTVSVVSVLCGIVFHRVVEKGIIKNV